MTNPVSGGFQFTPVQGLNDASAYPSTPANEAAARQQVMDLYWQLLNEMNNPTLSAAAYAQYNKIINGNFDVAQRGTSFSNPANGMFTLDRHNVTNNPDGGTLPTIVHSQLVLNPVDLLGSRFAYRINTNGAGSAFGINAVYGFKQRIENMTRYLCGVGKKITVSFKARSDIANKKIGIFFEQRYGSGGSPSASELINGKFFTLTNAFQTFSFTFNTNSLVGKTFGTNNDDYCQISLVNTWGSTFSQFIGDTVAEGFGGSGNTDIAQFQVCSGDVSLPFQPRSFAEELVLCKRYYERIGTGATGVFYNASSLILQWRYLVEKRVIPTLTLLTSTPLVTANGAYLTGSGATITNASHLAPTKTGAGVAMNGFTGRTTGEFVSINQDDLISADAEL